MAQVIHRYGKAELVKAAVASATVIERGDLVYFDTSTHQVKNAAAFTWDTNLATTQAAFAEVFLGIAEEASASGETDPISINVSRDAVYEIDCVSGTYHLDDAFGPDEDSGSVMFDQKLETATEAASIARCVKEMSAAGTRVYVKFAPAYSMSNVNANLG